MLCIVMTMQKMLPMAAPVSMAEMVPLMAAVIARRMGIRVIVALVGSLVILKGELPSSLFSAPIALLVVALVFLVWGGGVGGIVESLSAVGNIISYVRIAAIGLSSAILAMVAGAFVDTFGVSVFGLFMAFAIHLLNFALAIGGASLHSSRLHYVEFLGKFYQSGALQYRPFSRRGKTGV